MAFIAERWSQLLTVLVLEVDNACAMSPHLRLPTPVKH